MKKLFMAGGALAAVAACWAAKDPVIMTVNGVDVPLSEFEYLYRKNSRQQLEPQPLSEYVEMFKLYKLKVADAIADRLDTLPSFKKEMEQYRADLAAPYMADSAYIRNLVAEEFGWSKQEAEARHIMKFTRPGDKTARATLDSIRNVLVQGTSSWDETALKYSDDQGSNTNGGNMGYISAMKFPYSFEKAVFTTPEGVISEIVETPNTVHIIMGGKKRPSRGKVLTAHILKMCPQGATPEEEAKAKHEIDSLYAVIENEPASFGLTARNNSDDKGSARQDGRLPAFGAGEMVPEFDEVAFSIADGQISRPFRSRFGWHILQRIKGIPGSSEEDVKHFILNRINNPQDGRFRMVLDNQTAKLMATHNGKVNDMAIEEMTTYMSANGIDSLFYERFGKGKGGEMPVITFGKNAIKRADMLKGMHQRIVPDPKSAIGQFEQYQSWFINKSARDQEMKRLEAEEPEYRNLLNEYRDGSLLYEASVRKVWDKASQDPEALEAFFKAHRDDYKWDKPHVKGYLVQALNDSVAQEIKDLMSKTGTDSMVYTVRKNFKGNMQIDHISVGKGDNAMVDYLVFDGPKVSPRITNFQSMFMFMPRIIDQPEEAADVRGQVTTDFQNLLQEQWNEELRRKYPVKVNEKVLKKVRK